MEQKLFAKMASAQLAQYLLRLNKEVSKTFCAQIGQRRAWRKIHPTEFIIIQCMDGRVNLLKLCGISLGLATIFENIGGKFELTWPSFLDALWGIEAYARKNGSPVCLIITYHWSKSDDHLGCAGFEYKTEIARQWALGLKNQADYIFGDYIESVVIGIETDGWSLKIHGQDEGDQLLTLSMSRKESDNVIPVHNLCSIKNEVAIKDLSAILTNNVRKIVKKSHKIIPLSHAERIICIGPHFDWLTRNTHNLCFSVSGHDPRTDFAVSKAATLVQHNIEQGKAFGGGIVFSCFPYRQSRHRRGAELLARSYAEMAKYEIGKLGLTSLFKIIVGSINMDDRSVKLIKF